MHRRHLFVGAAALGLCAFAPGARPVPGSTVTVIGRNIVLKDGGTSRPIPTRGDVESAAISTDGRTVAYVEVVAYSAEEGTPNPTSLYVYDVASGRSRELLASTPGDTPQTNLESFTAPTFSLDGGYVYVMAHDAWATSDAIHQVSVKTGAHRFVVDGNSLAVIRNGRWAGYLLVNRHQYYGAPDYGAYDPWFVVRPDGKETFEVPGTRSGDPADLERWMKANGVTAS